MLHFYAENVAFLWKLLGNVIFISFSIFSHIYPVGIAKTIANDLDFYIYYVITQREMRNLKILCEKNVRHFPGYNKK